MRMMVVRGLASGEHLCVYPVTWFESKRLRSCEDLLMWSVVCRDVIWPSCPRERARSLDFLPFLTMLSDTQHLLRLNGTLAWWFHLILILVQLEVLLRKTGTRTASTPGFDRDADLFRFRINFSEKAFRLWIDSPALSESNMHFFFVCFMYVFIYFRSANPDLKDRAAEMSVMSWGLFWPDESYLFI